MDQLTDRDKAVAFLASIETGDQAALQFAGRYRQHNLGIADGVAGLVEVLGQLPPGSARVNTVRAFQDGDHVVTHTEYDFFGPKIGFDVFRFEDGVIAEHWDNLQTTPAAANPSGRSMIDGPTEVTDLYHTADNKALARAFVDDILIGGRVERFADYCDGDRYIQHNPQIGDGVRALATGLAELAAQGVTIEYDRIHKVLGQGNFVLVISEGKLAGEPTAYHDLFRIERGKIAEHWDVIQAIPPRSEWKNDNGKF